MCVLVTAYGKQVLACTESNLNSYPFVTQSGIPCTVKNVNQYQNDILDSLGLWAWALYVRQMHMLYMQLLAYASFWGTD